MDVAVEDLREGLDLGIRILQSLYALPGEVPLLLEIILLGMRDLDPADLSLQFDSGGGDLERHLLLSLFPLYVIIVGFVDGQVGLFL